MARSRARGASLSRKVVRQPIERVAEPRRAVRHRRHGVTATPTGKLPTAMSVGCLVLVLTSIVDTVPLPTLATKAVLPAGVTATPTGNVPTGMSVGCDLVAGSGIEFTDPVDTLKGLPAEWQLLAVVG
jgi:hypothetical protein